MQQVKKIAIIGPESTGKSTLSAQLAEHYNTLWCPEYAREYLTQKGTNYTFEDLAVIAKHQLSMEDKFIQKVAALQQAVGDEPASAENGKGILFIDTEMYVMKVWCEFVFGQCHKFILDEIATRTYDLFLLCKPDLTWVNDPLREYPDEKRRTELYHYYKDLMANQPVPFAEISSEGPQRLQMAIQEVNKLVK
jgi:NadR type nicotinamide-nucleotide adenylyltransferase